jgi:DNA-binding phage protein
MVRETQKAEVFTEFDIAAHLESEDDIAGYLDALREEGDAESFAAGLAYVAKRRRYNAVELNAQCDFHAPMPADLQDWDDAPPVGSEGL